MPGGNGDGRRKTAEEESIERIIHSIRMIVRALDVLSRRLASAVGVTSPQLSCLRYVVENGAATVSEVANAIHLSASTVVGIVDRLEEKELLVRQRDTKDRRVVFLMPTDAGSELMKGTRHPVRAMFEDKESNGLTEKDYERIATALEDIVGALAENEDSERNPISNGRARESACN
jgi:DNA-binding MarR family transcriptional regulator